ncbi:hypothetical protein EVAR_31286_1 [Eumeta japonica]|uniref:Uncharacterized protein n=1 Tax=Eumeta variegata TaxID=151549 RepID=A0A4C1VR68_EUMVA|nr:hypothetical protein EVAR_31286_1 [Eumeta japonica]
MNKRASLDFLACSSLAKGILSAADLASGDATAGPFSRRAGETALCHDKGVVQRKRDPISDLPYQIPFPSERAQ